MGCGEQTLLQSLSQLIVLDGDRSSKAEELLASTHSKKSIIHCFHATSICFVALSETSFIAKSSSEF